MSNDTSAALGRIKAALDYKHRHVQLTEAQARAILAHLAALEARAEWAEAFGHVFHTLPDGRLDFVAVREGSELGKLHQRAEAAEAREAELRAVLKGVDDDVRHHLRSDRVDHAVLRKHVVQMVRQALAAAPTAPTSRESRVAKLERLLREARADVEYIADAESGSAEGAASRDLLADIDAALGDARHD